MNKDYGPFDLQVGDEVIFRNGHEGVVFDRKPLFGAETVYIRTGCAELHIWAGGKWSSYPGIKNDYDVIALKNSVSVEDFL